MLLYCLLLIVSFCFLFWFSCIFFVFFFFSSRRRHTRCLSDWSSDVCSSDLPDEISIILAIPLAARILLAPAIMGLADRLPSLRAASALYGFLTAALFVVPVDRKSVV